MAVHLLQQAAEILLGVSVARVQSHRLIEVQQRLVAAAHIVQHGSQVWDLATVLKFMTGDLGYKGLFSIETNSHEGVRNIYNIILANI